ncbi:four-carbon acid sugar kinase family protein [Kocuria massiliensis]|uniref:four-carbon acid sugar kinase family protein n=1 Tax=Kocuria massiliensis TaxID=1926282 RepID=UPI0022B96AD4|nr:four-carbon acid sugar kinase family protein [Kocuria massiliensis]
MNTSPRRLLVLDDDPTGSQCVHDVRVAFDLDPCLIRSSLREPGSTCFALTNSRSLSEEDAVEINRRTLAGYLETAETSDGPLHVVSRSDSTLRGHVIAEPNALADTLADHGLTVDGFLFCPAMIEAGRFTEEDIHYAVVDGTPRPVAETDFARDATFGYGRSDLAQFLEEKSHGAVKAEDVLRISLEDIRTGGTPRVAEILARATNRRWVVVNATDYADMDIVAEAVTLLEERGHRFITRSGPSFVRPLSGQRDPRILGPDDIRIDPRRSTHGLVVVGSHVGLTTEQLRVVQERGDLVEIELNVAELLDPAQRERHLEHTTRDIRRALEHDDVAVYTSRSLVSDADPAESLRIARSVSDAVVEVVRRTRDAHPAWVIAKGGITSHEVAARGLDIRAANVAGQFFPGQISLFEPVTAPDDIRACPYVVFPGNVGSTEALAEVIERLQTATA